MNIIVILALNNYAIILRNICLIMIVIFVMVNNLVGTYACVWGIIGDYVYTLTLRVILGDRHTHSS